MERLRNDINWLSVPLDAAGFVGYAWIMSMGWQILILQMAVILLMVILALAAG